VTAPTVQHYSEAIRLLDRLVENAPGYLAFPLSYRLALHDARRFLDEAPRLQSIDGAEPQAE
jgi:hypothetical protein